MINHELLRKVLKEKFIETGKRYREVSESIGYAEQTVSHYMCGKDSTKRVAKALCDYFGIDIEKYMNGGHYIDNI